MTQERRSPDFWQLSKGAQISMWVIVICISVLTFILGRESLKTSVEANATINKVQNEQIERAQEDVVEIKQMIKESVQEINESMKEQSQKIDRLYRRTME